MQIELAGKLFVKTIFKNIRLIMTIWPICRFYKGERDCLTFETQSFVSLQPYGRRFGYEYLLVDSGKCKLIIVPVRLSSITLKINLIHHVALRSLNGRKRRNIQKQDFRFGTKSRSQEVGCRHFEVSYRFFLSRRVLR